MPERFRHHRLDGRELLVWGDTDVLAISFPQAKTLRLRALPGALYTTFSYPEPPAKVSWAVLDRDPLPLNVEQEGQELRITGGGLTLTLDLTAGAWAVGDSRGARLASGQAATGHPDNATQRCTDIHRTTLKVDAPPEAAYLGFGEKVGPLDKRGRRLTFWNTDCFPFGLESDPLYISIPFTLVLKGEVACGLFADESWRLEADVAASDAEVLRWVSAGPELDLYILAGPTPAKVVERYAALTGRHPLPPLWSLGYAQSRWGYENEDDVRAVVRGFRSRNLPLDAVYLDIDYMEGYKVFTWDSQRFPDPAGLIAELAGQGVQVVPIVDAGIKVESGYAPYKEALAGDLLVRTGRGEVLVGEVWPDPAVFPDFTRENVRAWWARQMKTLSAAGVLGVWTDMNEPACFRMYEAPADAGEMSRAGAVIEGKTLPYDALHGKKRHLEMHNVYALGMNWATRAGLAQAAPRNRPFVISRAGYAGQQRHAAIWTGDNVSTWEHLALSVPMLCGLGLSGMALCGSDVGGFAGDVTGELLVRWTQLGAFYPFMRNHSVRGVSMQEPWRFGPACLEAVRAAMHWRYRLLPTLYTLVWRAHRQGTPIMRPLIYDFPGDPVALGCQDEFLFGPALLVAPVVVPGAAARTVYLPAGRWHAFGGLNTSGKAFDGEQTVTAQAGLCTLPLFLRAGAALALTSAAEHTTDANWSALTWHVTLAPNICGELYEDAGDGDGPARVTTLTGHFDGTRLTLERETDGALGWMRDTETLHLHGFSEVTAVDGVSEWQFNEALHLLQLTVPVNWLAVTVEGAGHV